jgi:hypothetical protein
MELELPGRNAFNIGASEPGYNVCYCRDIQRNPYGNQWQWLQYIYQDQLYHGEYVRFTGNQFFRMAYSHLHFTDG